jgi:hypothetical protein
VAEVRQAGSRHEADISGSDDGHAHVGFLASGLIYGLLAGAAIVRRRTEGARAMAIV